MKKLCLLFLVCALFTLEASQEVSKLTLNATATVWKPSDELQLKIGIVTLGETAGDALAENSAKMNAVLIELQRIGLTRDEYETHQFSIQPTYTPAPLHPPANWKPSINGYEVTNTLLVRTAQLDLAGRIIDAANAAGSNQISDIRFGLKNSREYWSEALTAAGRNAVRDAEAIAAATGVRLVRVLSISLNNTQVQGREIGMMCMARGAAATPIEAGDVSITANVSVVYEIF
jgi:uncharacterized protein YggE